MRHFVNTVRDNTHDPANIDKRAWITAQKYQKNTQEFVGQQFDPTYLQQHDLPPVPKQMTGPIINTGTKFNRPANFVVGNDAHSNITNPGFSRMPNSGQMFRR